jgi:hypothetical protein
MVGLLPVDERRLCSRIHPLDVFEINIQQIADRAP